jgi:tetratricopeptide (TPR) repeat protein
VSWGVTLDDVAAARDALLAEVGERRGSHPLERLARAHRWLGDEDEARRRFREAAAAAQAALERWGREDVSAIGRIGSLLLRAGDEAAAQSWLERAARGQPRRDDAAALSYLRGDLDGAVANAHAAVAEEGRYPWAEAVALLAGARRDGDAERAAEAERRFGALIGNERTPPDEESGSSNLSLFDWLEESARVQAELVGAAPPSHAELLERAGLLRAERTPERPAAPADAGPSRPGSATISYPGPAGGEVTPSVTVDDGGDIHFVLDPARDLRASLVQDDGMWRARLGDAELPGSFRGPRAAKRALWDPLREQPDGQWAVALVDKLFRDSYRLP